MIKSTKIRNVNIFAFPSRDTFLDFIQNKHKILVAMNAEKILKDDIKFQEIINNNIGYPDGSGAVMALKKKGIEAVKIPGAEFWLDIVTKCHKDKSFYLLGGTQEVIQMTISKLELEYPKINILGFKNGFLNLDDKSDLINDLHILKPDIVFVAQGSPRQEFLMEELMNQHKALYMGLGGSFDVYCGLKRRAPKLFIHLNLEWLYRLLSEPTRIARQTVLLKYYYLLKMNRL